ncbi:hypothetical protein JCM10207_002138 [Rhodosporidiobolus poonsookiae]
MADTITALPATRSPSPPPRGAAGFGSTSPQPADKTSSSRSPSRSRSPHTGLFSNLARSISRSMSRSRDPASPDAVSSRERSASREPRGAAGLGGRSRDPSQARGRSGEVAAEGQRVSSVSRTRRALDKVLEMGAPVAAEQRWASAGYGEGKERSASRGRAADGKENTGTERTESRARSLARSALSGAAADRAA